MYTLTVLAFLVFVAGGRARVQVPQKEFQNALTWNGFPAPSRSNYEGFLSSLRVGNIGTKLEAAMFLAQILHESGGLRYKEELYCTVQGNPCTVYQSGDWTPGCNRPGKRYFGRGYIQLSYCSNYRAASRALGLADRLADQPELVSQNENLSWQTAAWFWKTNVKPALLKGPPKFGLTTAAINGQREECQGNGKNADKSRQRFQYYKNIYRAFRLPGAPNESGCNY